MKHSIHCTCRNGIDRLIQINFESQWIYIIKLNKSEVWMSVMCSRDDNCTRYIPINSTTGMVLAPEVQPGPHIMSATK